MIEGPAPDRDAISAFLRAVDTDGQVVLIAIPGERHDTDTDTKTFTDDLDVWSRDLMGRV